MSKKFYTIALSLLLSLTAYSQNALRFDGADDYAESTLSGPTGSGSRTVEAWVNLGLLTSSQKVILDWGDMATGSRFTLNIISGTPRIEVGNSGFSSSTSIALNTWHHIAATFDNNASPQVILYLDGVQVISGTFSVPVYTSAASGIIIGRRNDGINNFEGILDEVRVWDVVRSSSQIVADMNKEYCSVIPAGLVAYFNLNQGIAGGNNAGLTTLNDFSGNNNNATLYNFALTGNNSNFVSGAPITGNSTASISPAGCQSYTSPSGLYTYTSSGIYHDTIPNATGCDSIISINLTLTTVDTSVNVAGATLQANFPNALYQWLDCNNNYAPVAGATFQTFTPTANGSYAVKITKFGCTDTSACYVITNVGVADLNGVAGINIYPNPFKDKFTVTIPALTSAHVCQIRIFDLQGRVIYFSSQPVATSVEMNAPLFDRGVYFIEITSGNSIFREKLVKE